MRGYLLMTASELRDSVGARDSVEASGKRETRRKRWGRLSSRSPPSRRRSTRFWKRPSLGSKPMQWRLREPEADQWRGGARYRPAGWRCEPHRERVVFISN